LAITTFWLPGKEIGEKRERHEMGGKGMGRK